MHRFADTVAAFVFNVFYNWIQCKNSCPLHYTVAQDCVLPRGRRKLSFMEFHLETMKWRREYAPRFIAPFSINLLRSVAPHSRSMSQFISFISSSLALIICRSCCCCCCCASCLALPWSCILCGAESVSLNGFGFGFATFTFTYWHSYSHTHIRMYSCAHISCLAAVCGLEYSLVVPKSKPQLNRSTGSYNSNSNRHNNNTATTQQQQQLQQLGATKYEIISFEAVEIKWIKLNVSLSKCLWINSFQLRENWDALNKIKIFYIWTLFYDF